jgi:xanthine dehydrogenase accessory factor
MVLGCDEVASAIGRELHLAGNAVVLIDDVDPPWSRRGMSYVDAWYVGGATLEEVDACFCGSLKSIPAVLARGDMIAATTWSWQGVAASLQPVALVDARLSAEAGALRAFGGIVAVAERNGDASLAPRITAPRPGRFGTRFEIAERVTAGELVGEIGNDPVVSPATGALRALAARGARLAIGGLVAEIEPSGEAHRCFGVDPAARTIARRVSAAVGSALNAQRLRSPLPAAESIELPA